MDRTPLPTDGRRLVGKYVRVPNWPDGPIWRIDSYNQTRDRFAAHNLKTPDVIERISFDDLRANYAEGYVDFGREPKGKR